MVPFQTSSAVDPAMDAMAAAERELAMYAAIIGHRPTVGSTAHSPEGSSSETVPTSRKTTQAPIAESAIEHESESHLTLSLYALHLDSAELKHRVSGWVKQVSVQAKRRIDEAKMRLAG